MASSPAMLLVMMVFLGLVAAPPVLVVSIVGFVALVRAAARIRRALDWRTTVRRLSWSGTGDPAPGPICVEGTVESQERVKSLVGGVPCVGSAIEVRASSSGKVRVGASEVSALSLVVPGGSLRIDGDSGARLLGGWAELVAPMSGPEAPLGLRRSLEAIGAGDVMRRRGRVLEWRLDEGDACTVIGELRRPGHQSLEEGPYRGLDQLQLSSGRFDLVVIAGSREALLARLEREARYGWGKLGVVAAATAGTALGVYRLLASGHSWWLLYASPLILLGLVALEASRRARRLPELPPLVR